MQPDTSFKVQCNQQADTTHGFGQKLHTKNNGFIEGKKKQMDRKEEEPYSHLDDFNAGRETEASSSADPRDPHDMIE